MDRSIDRRTDGGYHISGEARINHSRRVCILEGFAVE